MFNRLCDDVVHRVASFLSHPRALAASTRALYGTLRYHTVRIPLLYRANLPLLLASMPTVRRLIVNEVCWPTLATPTPTPAMPCLEELRCCLETCPNPETTVPGDDDPYTVDAGERIVRGLTSVLRAAAGTLYSLSLSAWVVNMPAARVADALRRLPPGLEHLGRTRTSYASVRTLGFIVLPRTLDDDRPVQNAHAYLPDAPTDVPRLRSLRVRFNGNVCVDRCLDRIATAFGASTPHRVTLDFDYTYGTITTPVTMTSLIDCIARVGRAASTLNVGMLDARLRDPHDVRRRRPDWIDVFRSVRCLYTHILHVCVGPTLECQSPDAGVMYALKVVKAYVNLRAHEKGRSGTERKK